MIEKLSNNVLINDSVKSVYNFNEYSIQDLLSKFFEKINDCVETSNKALSFLEWLKKEGLPNEVIKELENMYQNGKLTELIDNLANNLTLQIMDMKNNYIPNYNINGGDF